MNNRVERVTEVLVLGIPETAGSALYGMVDVLCSAGNLWQTLVRTRDESTLFNVQIVSPSTTPFTCGNGIPIRPNVSLSDDPHADVIILPEIWLGPDEVIAGRYPKLIEWIANRYEASQISSTKVARAKKWRA